MFNDTFYIKFENFTESDFTSLNHRRSNNIRTQNPHSPSLGGSSLTFSGTVQSNFHKAPYLQSSSWPLQRTEANSSPYLLFLQLPLFVILSSLQSLFS